MGFATDRHPGFFELGFCVVAGQPHQCPVSGGVGCGHLAAGLGDPRAEQLLAVVAVLGEDGQYGDLVCGKDDFGAHAVA